VTAVLKPWQHAAASTAILMTGLLLLGGSVVWPAVAHRRDLHERIDELVFQERKLVSLLRERPRIVAELEQLKRTAEDRSGFLTEASTALAAAALQKRLTDLVESTGGELVSAQTVDEVEPDDFLAVKLRLQIRGDTGVLQTVLYEMESGQPHLSVDNLTVQKRQSRARRAGEVAPDRLEIRFDVRGYLYGVESS
jgi:general secretion pathway protein M